MGLPEWAGLWLVIDGSGVARQSCFTSRNELFKVDMATDRNEKAGQREGGVDRIMRNVCGYEERTNRSDRTDKDKS